MMNETTLLMVAFTVILNIIGGYMRAQYPPKSKARIRCLYIPITLIIVVRTSVGASWSIVPYLFVLAVGCIFLGTLIAKRFGKGYQQLSELATEPAVKQEAD